jgi:hypothetical protein
MDKIGVGSHLKASICQKTHQIVMCIFTHAIMVFHDDPFDPVQGGTLA